MLPEPAVPAQPGELCVDVLPIGGRCIEKAQHDTHPPTADYAFGGDLPAAKAAKAQQGFADLLCTVRIIQYARALHNDTAYNQKGGIVGWSRFAAG